MNVIHYTRVSTDEQAERGFSLPYQQSALERFSLPKEGKVYGIWKDDFTGKHFNRPGWKDLMLFLKQNRGKIDYILFLRWDRFSRDLTAALIMIEKLKKLKVRVNAIEQWIDMDSPGYVTQLAMYLSIAQDENEKNSARTTEASRTARLHGCWTGTAPLGLKNHRNSDMKSTLLPTEKAEVVYKAFSDMALGIYSAESIWKKYKKLGLLPPSFSKQAFLNMLRNVAYIGKVYVKPFKNLPAEIVDGLHPAIIAEDVFYRVQKNLQRKPRTNLKEINQELYPLKSILKCPIHNIQLTASKSRSRNKTLHHYYHCSKNLCRYRFRVDNVHSRIQHMLQSLQPKKKVLQLYEQILKNVFEKADQQRKDDIRKQESLLQSLIGQKQELQTLLLTKKISSEDYNEMRNSLVDKIRNLQSDLRNLTDEPTPYHKFINRGFHLLSNLSKCFATYDAEVKQKILGSIFPEKLIIEKETFRTSRLNKVVSLIAVSINDLEIDENEKAGNNSDFFNQAPPVGLEPTTL